MFDAINGVVESGKTYLRDSEKVKGFFFMVSIALRIGFKILRVLKNHYLLGKMYVNKIIF